MVSNTLNKLTLITPYYQTSNDLRQAELDTCLANNLNNFHIDEVILLIDDGAIPSHTSGKMKVHPLNARPTYLDWFRVVDLYSISGNVILANSDIYFDDSLSEIDEVLSEPNTFMALSRWEVNGNSISSHPNPEWSQDSWAFSADSIASEGLLERLDFGLGVPRCDNKIAYVFATQGWGVRNPYHTIKSMHLHESAERSYSKRSDDRIVGGVAYVYPNNGPGRDSRLHLDIWSLKSHNVTEVSVNNNLEKWKEADAEPSWVPMSSVALDTIETDDNLGRKLEILKLNQKTLSIAGEFAVYESELEYLLVNSTMPKSWVVLQRPSNGEMDPQKTLASLISPLYNFHFPPISDVMDGGDDIFFWQYPCWTEKQAYESHLKVKHGSHVDEKQKIVNIYVPLPWATFIDKKSTPDELLRKLSLKIQLAKRLAETFGYTLNVHTVCQHIHWRRLLDTFMRLGVNNLSISHAEKTTQKEVRKMGYDLKIRPWTLYAVNYANKDRSEGLDPSRPIKKREYLASFIGAHMNHYRSDVRLRMSEGLSALQKTDLLIDIGNEWHFNKIVYNEQVESSAIRLSDIEKENVATVRYNEFLTNSKFALCPEGAGPNTLRFWEAIATGSIPVLFDTALQFPWSADEKLNELCLFWDEYEIGEGLYDWLSSFSEEELDRRSIQLRKVYKSMEMLTCF